MAKIIGDISGGPNSGGSQPPTGGGGEPQGSSPPSESSILDEIMDGTYGNSVPKTDVNPRLISIIKLVHKLMTTAMQLSTSQGISSVEVDQPVPEMFQGQRMPDLNDE